MSDYIFPIGLLVAFSIVWPLSLWLVARLVRAPIMKQMEEMSVMFGLAPTASHAFSLSAPNKAFLIEHLLMQADILERSNTPEALDLDPDAT